MLDANAIADLASPPLPLPRTSLTNGPLVFTGEPTTGMDTWASTRGTGGINDPIIQTLPFKFHPAHQITGIDHTYVPRPDQTHTPAVVTVAPRSPVPVPRSPTPPAPKRSRFVILTDDETGTPIIIRKSAIITVELITLDHVDDHGDEVGDYEAAEVSVVMGARTRVITVTETPEEVLRLVEAG